VFVNLRGKRITPRGVQLAMKRLFDGLARGTELHVHALRHSFATTCSTQAPISDRYRNYWVMARWGPRKCILIRRWNG